MARDSLTLSRSGTARIAAARVPDVAAPTSDPGVLGDCPEILMHLSHEIRTPLNSILALSQLLRDGMAGTLNSEQQKYVEVIERNGQNLIRLVTDVLDLARLESGRIEVETRSLDLGDQLRATVAALAPLAEVKKIALCVGPVDGLPPVRCDPDRLRQVLTNLIGNAIKFTDRGQVVLSVEAREDAVAIHVADTGVGIPEHARSHLFEEFFQAGERDARQREGAGLGLAIANRLVRLMGGQISVESVEGVGSRFTFTLPMVEAAFAATDAGIGDVGCRAADPSDGSGTGTGTGTATERAGGGVRLAHRSRDERHGTNTAGR